MQLLCTPKGRLLRYLAEHTSYLLPRQRFGEYVTARAPRGSLIYQTACGDAAHQQREEMRVMAGPALDPRGSPVELRIKTSAIELRLLDFQRGTRQQVDPLQARVGNGFQSSGASWSYHPRLVDVCEVEHGCLCHGRLL